MRRKIAMAAGFAMAAGVLLAAVYLVELTSATEAAAGPNATVACPLSASGAAVKTWAFSARSADLTTSLRGRGSYTPARASGTACQANTVTDLVMSIEGRGKLSRGVSRGGATGAQLVLKVRIAQTDLARCKAGMRGTLTLFSSYNGAHRDSVKLRLQGCRGETLGVANAGVHVSIQR